MRGSRRPARRTSRHERPWHHHNNRRHNGGNGHDSPVYRAKAPVRARVHRNACDRRRIGRGIRRRRGGTAVRIARARRHRHERRHQRRRGRIQSQERQAPDQAHHRRRRILAGEGGRGRREARVAGCDRDRRRLRLRQHRPGVGRGEQGRAGLHHVRRRRRGADAARAEDLLPHQQHGRLFEGDARPARRHGREERLHRLPDQGGDERSREGRGESASSRRASR